MKAFRFTPRSVAAILAIGCFAALAGCMLSPPFFYSSRYAPGHLIIAGGGTSAENQGIYSRFMAPLPQDAIIGVVPTASGAAEESAASSATTLRRYAGLRTVRVIDITTKSPERASDPQYVKQIKECNALWFTGGDQSRIVATFRSKSGGTTPALSEMEDVLENGGVIGGTSAGAAMMSDPMITGGSSEEALAGKFRSGSGDTGLGTGRGMGFFRFGLIDQHFLRRGRFGRLVVALERTGVSRGYGIEENCALEVDCRSGRLIALGPVPAVVVVDMYEARVRDGAHRGVRISLLCNGDWVDAKTRAVHPQESRRPVSKVGDLPQSALPEAWSPGALTMAIRALAAAPDQSVTLSSKGFTVTLRADTRSKFFVDPAAPELLTVTDILLEIEPKP